MLARFIADEQGATSIEYAIIAVVICVGIIASLQVFVGSLRDLFQHIAAGLLGVNAS